MTPRQVRAALRGAFAAAGFAEEGSQFVAHTAELTHAVDVAAVRRLPGTVQIHHHVHLRGRAVPALTEELASHRLGTEYPVIWSAAAVDAGLLMAQVLAIHRVFRTRHDLAHHFADREPPHPDAGLSDAGGGADGPASSLTAAQAAAILQRLARELLDGDFALVPSGDDYEIWASRQAIDGFHHCAYVEANTSATLATIVGFALPAAAIDDRLRHDDSRRQLFRAHRQVVFRDARPLLMPMTAAPLADADAAAIRAALAEHRAQNPPNGLPR